MIHINRFEDIQGIAYKDDTKSETYMYLPMEPDSRCDLCMSRVNVTGFRKQGDKFIMQGTTVVNCTRHRGANGYTDILADRPAEFEVMLTDDYARLHRFKPVLSCYLKAYSSHDYKPSITVGIPTAEGEIEHEFTSYKADGYAITAMHRMFSPLCGDAMNHMSAESRAEVLEDWVMQLLPGLQERPEMRYAGDPVNELRSLLSYSNNQAGGNHRLDMSEVMKIAPYVPWLPAKKPFNAAVNYKVQVIPLCPVIVEQFYADSLRNSRAACILGSEEEAITARDLANKNLKQLMDTNPELAVAKQQNKQNKLETPNAILDTAFLYDLKHRHIAMLSKVLVKPIAKAKIEERLCDYN